MALINQWRMRSEGYGTWFVCLSVSQASCSDIRSPTQTRLHDDFLEFNWISLKKALKTHIPAVLDNTINKHLKR